MTQRVTIGEATLYCGDALEILPTLGGVAQLAVTDPPYRISSGGSAKSGFGMAHGARGLSSGIFASENYDNGGNLFNHMVEWDEWPPLLFSALAEDADAYVMANDKNVNPAANACLAAGFQLHNLLVWHKRTAVANRWYMKDCEFTLYLWKGRARPVNGGGAKQLVSLGHKDVSKHPTEKPVPLMALYIANSSQVGDTVLDPFMGSGTTGVAATQLQRRFVGIEKDPRFFEMACERIAGAKAQGRLFGEMPKHQAALDLLAPSDAITTTNGGIP